MTADDGIHTVNGPEGSQYADEGLPIQRYNFQNRMFSKRQIEMMTISMSRVLTNR
jgi:hypothetical protein